MGAADTLRADTPTTSQRVDDGVILLMISSVIPTPEQALPVLEPLASALPSAIRDGVEQADAVQPDALTRDNYFWSHCARFYNKRSLNRMHGSDWHLIEDVPNTGIHIVLNGVHRIRVLRSLGGLVPHPGSNGARRAAWSQPPAQGRLFHSAENELLVDPPEDKLPAMNLLIDWHLKDGEPVISVSLPRAPWEYEQAIRVHWRRPLPSDEDFAGLSFSPPPVNDDFGSLVEIDPGEFG